MAKEKSDAPQPIRFHFATRMLRKKSKDGSTLFSKGRIKGKQVGGMFGRGQG